MNIPGNIHELSEKNAALLEIMGFDRKIDDPLSLCNPVAYSQTGLFTETMIAAMFNGSPEPTKRSQHRISSAIGMILIRPDMVHAVPEFETFVSDRFHLLHKASVMMDKEMYWQIYSHDLYRPETMHSRLTRAALYIGSPCCLMVFKDRMATPARSVPNYVCTTLKGSQGRYQPDTLRGDIVYRNAIKLGLHRLQQPDIDDRIRLAVDPFGAYQALSSQPSGSHAGLQFPLLFYTGVGVHVPDSSEIDTDLPQMLHDLPQILAATVN